MMRSRNRISNSRAASLCGGGGGCAAIGTPTAAGTADARLLAWDVAAATGCTSPGPHRNATADAGRNTGKRLVGPPAAATTCTWQYREDR